MENETQYAMIAATQMYGQRDNRALVGMTSKAEAEAWAETYNPDYDAEAGCCRLAHNQAAATKGEAREITYKGGTYPLDDWGLLPDDVCDALIDKGREMLEDDTACADVLGDHGLEIFCLDNRDYVMVRK